MSEAKIEHRIEHESSSSFEEKQSDYVRNDDDVEIGQTKEAYIVADGSGEVRELAHEMQDRLGAELGVSEHDIEYMHNIIVSMTVEEAREILTKFLQDHDKDPNIPTETLETVKEMLSDNSHGVEDIEGMDVHFAMKAHAALIHYHSPYPEVRAVTDPYDNVDEPVETIRAYVIGIIWVIVSTGVQQFFEPHYPSLIIPTALFQLLVLPSGYLWAYLIPDVGFNFRGKRISLSPGPWSAKEQVLATIMLGISNSIPYVNSQLVVQKLPMYYDQQWATVGYQILLTLSTQFMGFGIAGMLRSILVYPTKNLWMVNFQTLALNRSLMQGEKGGLANGWKIPRWLFFTFAFSGMFLWEWIPNTVMQFLQYFNWMTWIAPNNFNLAAITGSVSGLGLNPISTFDWNYINIAQPLITPFFSYCNLLIGAVFGAIILVPAVYWTNLYNTAYLPINSATVFDNTGSRYQVLNVLTNGVLDHDKYQAYSPPYYAAANIVVYGAFFANYTCIFVKTLLYHWRVMYDGYKEIFLQILGRGQGVHKFEDAHSRMMAKYPETPMWWFLVIMVISIGLSAAAIKGYPTHAPIWGIFFSIGIGIVFLVPIGNLYSQTNNIFSLNVFAELVAGYAVEGNGIAMMIVKALGVNTNLQAMYFMQDLKLGHYAKIPPRATFRAQILATLLSAFVMIGVLNWQLSNIANLCAPKDSNGNPNPFRCPNETVYFSASIIWGVIGPRRVFNQQYRGLKWAFLIGCFLPIPFWFIDVVVPKFIERRRAQRGEVEPVAPEHLSFGERAFNAVHRFNRFLDPNIMLMGMISFLAPYSLAMVIPGFYVCWAFMHYIRKRYVAWFERYNYVMSAAFSAGTSLALVLVFFALQYRAGNGKIPELPSWWGNNVPFAGVDGAGPPLSTLATGQFFGPPPGKFPW